MFQTFTSDTRGRSLPANGPTWKIIYNSSLDLPAYVLMIQLLSQLSSPGSQGHPTQQILSQPMTLVSPVDLGFISGLAFTATWFHFPELLTRNPGEVGVQCWNWVTSDANFLLLVNCIQEIRLYRPFVTHSIWTSQKLFVVCYNKVINVVVYYILIYFLEEGIKLAKQFRNVNFWPQSIIRNAFYCNPVQKNVWRERERETDRLYRNMDKEKQMKQKCCKIRFAKRYMVEMIDKWQIDGR